jgi:hypothetical protein
MGTTTGFKGNARGGGASVKIVTIEKRVTQVAIIKGS